MSADTIKREENNHSEIPEITKKDLNRAWTRWWFSTEISHSFDRMQAPSFMWSLMPILRKLYKSGVELKNAYHRHLMFFNTNANWGGGTILGIISSMEEQRAHGLATDGESDIDADAIYNIKAGLMGPLAGIGDSVDTFTIMYLLISIGLPWCQSGYWAGAVLPWLLFSIYQYFMGRNFTRIGYNVGLNSADTILNGEKGKSFIEVMSAVGMWMMGTLVASYVKISTPIKWMTLQGETTLQGIFDRILPGLLPFALTMAVYYYYTKVKFNIMRAVLALTVVLGVLAAVGIL